MRQFLNGNKEAYRDLEQRAQRACVRFCNQEMPPGCHPERADVGFEIDEPPGTARLLVSRGIVYRGAVADVAQWLQAGVKQFESFASLRRWIGGPLSQAFGEQSSAPAADSDVATGVTPTATE